MSLRKPRIINPGGCKWCGVERQNHCQLWHGPELGFGGFVDPTQEQIKERMLERRKLRSNTIDLHQPYPVDEEEKNFSDLGMPNAD